MFWNVCGIGNPDTLCQLKHLIRVNKINVLAIAEPKISGKKAEDICRKICFSSYHREDAQGFSGGL